MSIWLAKRKLFISIPVDTDRSGVRVLLPASRPKAKLPSMRMPRSILALVLVYLMTPGLQAVAQNLLNQGDSGLFEHMHGGASHDFGDAERGCQGPFHLCRCHRSTSFETPTVLALALSLEPPRTIAVPEHCSPHPTGRLDRIFRPPRS